MLNGYYSEVYILFYLSKSKDKVRAAGWVFKICDDNI